MNTQSQGRAGPMKANKSSLPKARAWHGHWKQLKIDLVSDALSIHQVELEICLDTTEDIHDFYELYWSLDDLSMI